MKNLLVAATLIVALSTVASADDFRPIFHPPTISILEALQRDPDNFSTLIDLLKKADLKEFREAKASYTLLAPTNAAFAKLSPEDLSKLTKEPEKLRQLILAHLLPGKVLFNQLFAPDKGGVAKKNITESLKTVDGGLAYFQCDEHPADPANQHHPLINKKARVLKSDIEGTYAVIQVIDAVLMPEKPGYAQEFRPIFNPTTISILEALQQDPDNFSTLIGLLMKADLKELREAKAPYTLLAPTNGAFAKLSPEYFAEIGKDPEKLRQLLLAHLLPGKVVFDQLFAPDKDGVAKKNVTESLKTANGGLAYFLCDAHPVDPAKEHHPLINKKARVLKSDIEGTYAVIQVIDAVLMPEELGYIRELPRPLFNPPTISILEALQRDPDNFSTLISLLQKADLKELSEAKASYTLLAPTNGAFAKLSPEYFGEINKDPEKLRQLLLAHLLTGKVLFNQLFAVDDGSVDNKEITKSLKTADGGLANLQCNGAPVSLHKEHHPLINTKARTLRSDIEGTYAVIQVIDTVLIP